MSATQAEIDTLIAEIQNALYEGDRTAGIANSAASDAIMKRNEELAKKKEQLVAEIKRKEAIIEQNNQDFSDVKKNTPEPIVNPRAHFIEDYTMFFLVLSYLFMVIVAIAVYTLASEEGMVKALLRGLGYGTAGTFLLFVLGYTVL